MASSKVTEEQRALIESMKPPQNVHHDPPVTRFKAIFYCVFNIVVSGESGSDVVDGLGCLRLLCCLFVGG